MNRDFIQLAHGGGGRLSRDLIAGEISSRFGDGPLRDLPDGATLPSLSGEIIFSTDSFVVNPIEFPGGNIGDLAVHGTVNDIAACAGRPLWLSLGLILEEGLPLAVLRRALDAVARATAVCGVRVATGDTKVVGKGQCDGIYINTSGIGEKLPGFDPARGSICPGDCVLVSGAIGDHGASVLAIRNGIDNGPLSDTGPVHHLVAAVTEYGAAVRFMRDPTRGGLAAVTNEITADLDIGICLIEQDIPISAGTVGVSEILGLDPLQFASEGRLLLICAPEASQDILRIWRTIDAGAASACIGSVTRDSGRVVMETVTGGRRLVDLPRGELLPRIC